MADFTSKAAEYAAPYLEPEERVVSAIRTQRRGSSNLRMAGGLLGGAVGSVASVVVGTFSSRPERGDGPAGATADRWPTEPMLALILTDRRLLVYRRFAFSDKPKEIALDLPRTLIREMSLDVTRSGLEKIPRVRIQFTDGSVVGLETFKIDHPERFIGALPPAAAAG
jgi:hypothetical protein